MTHDELRSAAKAAADKVEHCVDGWPAPQATVLFSKNGEVYIIENDAYEAVLAEMKRKGDTAVEAMSTFWKADNGADLHCFALRKALLELDEQNKDTLVLLGERAKKINDLMPPKK